jgi:hypothetical protein
MIVAGLLLFSGIFAQSKLRLGVHFDPVVSWFSPKTPRIEKDGGRPGISGGLILEYYFHENYGLASGLSITMLGGNLMYHDSVYISTGDESSVLVKAGSTVAYRANYLIIPLSLKLKTNQIGDFTYYAQLGLKQWINISARATDSGSGLSKDNVGKEINLYGMSYFFGGGIEYDIGGNTSINAGLYYDNGFTDVLSSNDHKACLNFITFRIGVFF